MQNYLFENSLPNPKLLYAYKLPNIAFHYSKSGDAILRSLFAQLLSNKSEAKPRETEKLDRSWYLQRSEQTLIKYGVLNLLIFRVLHTKKTDILLL